MSDETTAEQDQKTITEMRRRIAQFHAVQDGSNGWQGRATVARWDVEMIQRDYVDASLREIERLTAALATAEAARDAALQRIEWTQREYIKGDYTSMALNLFDGDLDDGQILHAEAMTETAPQPAAAPAVDAAPVGATARDYLEHARAEFLNLPTGPISEWAQAMMDSLETMLINAWKEKQS